MVAIMGPSTMLLIVLFRISVTILNTYMEMTLRLNHPADSKSQVYREDSFKILAS